MSDHVGNPEDRFSHVEAHITQLVFSNGGWILDNFPNTRDQWNQCIEKNMMPDDVIVLKDKGENSNYLLKRWYNVNREELDGQIRKRVEEEEERRRVAEEERRYYKHEQIFLNFYVE